MQKQIPVYFAIFLLHLLGQLFHLPWISLVTKPLLMPLLMLGVWFAGKAFPGKGVLLAALAFSWLGDVILMLSFEGSFIAGLLAFLLAHGVYIRLFFPEATFAPVRLLPFVMYVVLLLAGPLHGKLPADLQIPVYLYVVVLTGMGCMAALRNGLRPGYEQTLVGAALFILSDSFLALNKFVSPLPLEGFWVMLTYGLGQFFIVNGYLSGNDAEK